MKNNQFLKYVHVVHSPLSVMIPAVLKYISGTHIQYNGKKKSNNNTVQTAYYIERQKIVLLLWKQIILFLRQTSE